MKVQLHLVVTLEEVVQVGPLIDANVCELFSDLLFEVLVTEIKLTFLKFLKDVPREVERKNLLPLCLKFPAKFCSLQDPLCQRKLIFQGLDAIPGIHCQVGKALLALRSEMVHLRFELLKMLGNVVFLSAELLVPLLAFLSILSDLLLPMLDRCLHSLYLPQPPLNLVAQRCITAQVILVLGGTVFCRSLVVLQLVFAPGASVFDLLLQARSHLVVFLDVLVTNDLELGLVIRNIRRFAVFLLTLHLLYDQGKLAFFQSMSFLNVLALNSKLLLKCCNIAFELFIQREKPALLYLQEAVDIEEVASNSHLVLLLGFIQVSVQHLEDGILAVHVPLMVLRNDLDLLL
mmetsp:Transcript_3654/g.6523  ORF Transcript_3654/g.6523 Transcript_3654/m.6523 type:complete len:346 (+) Transcript_3654:315-1352(+)